MFKVIKPLLEIVILYCCCCYQLKSILHIYPSIYFSFKSLYLSCSHFIFILQEKKPKRWSTNLYSNLIRLSHKEPRQIKYQYKIKFVRETKNSRPLEDNILQCKVIIDVYSLNRDIKQRSLHQQVTSYIWRNKVNKIT